MKVLALIPARGGSKGIPRKNLARVRGKPLLAYAVEAALSSRQVTRTVVSTDDQEIARVARALGAEVPFLRPAELAADGTPGLPVIQHALRQLEAEGWRADCVAWLPPTAPLRRAEHVDAAIGLLRAERCDSVVSVVPVPHQFNPLSVLRLAEGTLRPFLSDRPPVRRRQDKPPAYARDGIVLVATRETLMVRGDLLGERSLPLVLGPETFLDVDAPEDLARLEDLLDPARR